MKKLVAIALIIYVTTTVVVVIVGFLFGNTQPVAGEPNALQQFTLFVQNTVGVKIAPTPDIATPGENPVPSEIVVEDTPTPGITEVLIITATPTEISAVAPTPTSNPIVSASTNTPIPTPTQLIQPTDTPIPPTVTPTTAPSVCGQGGSCTAAQVAAHNSQSDCWVIWASKVYNVTAYVYQHPGGSAAFDSTTCGHDITAYMEGVATTSGLSKTKNHPQSAYTILNSYFVANLN